MPGHRPHAAHAVRKHPAASKAILSPRRVPGASFSSLSAAARMFSRHLRLCSAETATSAATANIPASCKTTIASLHPTGSEALGAVKSGRASNHPSVVKLAGYTRKRAVSRHGKSAAPVRLISSNVWIAEIPASLDVELPSDGSAAHIGALIIIGFILTGLFILAAAVGWVHPFDGWSP